MAGLSALRAGFMICQTKGVKWPKTLRRQKLRALGQLRQFNRITNLSIGLILDTSGPK